MQTAVTTTTCLLMLVCHSVFGQESKKVQEPQYVGIISFLNSDTGELLALERQTPMVQTKAKAFGFGGAKRTMEINGEKSPNRITMGQQLIFIVRVVDVHQDPAGTIALMPFQSKNGKRANELAKVNAIGRVSLSSSISFDADVSRYGESSLKIKLTTNIPAGEYCIRHVDSPRFFCFGIDRLKK